MTANNNNFTHLWHFLKVLRAGSVAQQWLPTTTASLTSGTSESRLRGATVAADNNFTHLWHFLKVLRAGSVAQQWLPTTTASLTSGTS